jgi:hypothetical protein
LLQFPDRSSIGGSVLPVVGVVSLDQDWFT